MDGASDDTLTHIRGYPSQELGKFQIVHDERYVFKAVM
jgi:hypothetical protein